MLAERQGIDMNSEFKAFLELIWMLILDPRTGVLIGLLLAAAWSDCKTGRIPNILVLSGLVMGLTYNTIFPPFLSQKFPWAFEGAGAALAVMLPFYLLNAMSAGDVKLMTMSGAFLGFPAALWAALAVFLAGGALSLAYLVQHGSLRYALFNIVEMLPRRNHARLSLAANRAASAGTLPYGIAIATGTIAYLVMHQLGYVR